MRRFNMPGTVRAALYFAAAACFIADWFLFRTYHLWFVPMKYSQHGSPWEPFASIALAGRGIWELARKRYGASWESLSQRKVW